MPIIQLSFPNPLNTSVQVGDNAYFSNPIPVSTTGNPFGGQWEATVTPHMTNDIDGVVDLGEIVAIIPWNGTNSFIQCNMDQVLFNKYFASIVVGACEIIVDQTLSTGECADHIPQLDVIPITVSLTTGAQVGWDDVNEWYFNNPTVDINTPSFHIVVPTAVADGCLVTPPKIGFDPSQFNYWFSLSSVTMYPRSAWNGDINGDPIYLTSNGVVTQPPIAGSNAPMLPFTWAGTDPSTGIPLGYESDGVTPTNGEGSNFQAFRDWVNLHFPGVTNPTMSYLEFYTALEPYGVGELSYASGGPLYGSIVLNEDCTGGSYIMFSKDNKANMSSILGYYASVEYRNSSQIKSELFNVGADFFESSK
tara:strand:- start:1426 stop:2514 length:1089 start_codon:yes stop_codon:yes gene_type:complete